VTYTRGVFSCLRLGTTTSAYSHPCNTGTPPDAVALAFAHLMKDEAYMHERWEGANSRRCLCLPAATPLATQPRTALLCKLQAKPATPDPSSTQCAALSPSAAQPSAPPVSSTLSPPQPRSPQPQPRSPQPPQPRSPQPLSRAASGHLARHTGSAAAEAKRLELEKEGLGWVSGGTLRQRAVSVSRECGYGHHQPLHHHPTSLECTLGTISSQTSHYDIVQSAAPGRRRQVRSASSAI
jgi:hypothetical protein